MNDNLDQKTDEELDQIFALEVARWRRNLSWWVDRDGKTRDDSHFCASANKVLPWLEKWRYSEIDWNRITLLWTVQLQNGECVGSAATFARAAVIAMIRGNRKNHPQSPTSDAVS